MSEHKPEDLEREHIAEIEARVRATICPTFGSIERGGPPVETRQGRIFADDFEALLRYAQAGAKAMRDLEKAIPRLENCGKFIAKNNKGEWFYLNHANAWHQFQGYDEAQGVVSLLQSQTLRDLQAAQARVKELERVISALKKPTPEIFAEIENYYGVLMRGDLHPAEFLKEIVRAALQVKP